MRAPAKRDSRTPKPVAKKPATVQTEAHVDDGFVYQPEVVAKNSQTIDLMKTFVNTAGGVVSGICGLTGWMGFAAFFVYSIITTLYISLILMRGSSSDFVHHKSPLLSFGGLCNGMVTYIVVWTICYDVVHVF
eukprot:TRINITY_DN17150_c0_g1_i1.p1 TRINITY_DN17150_c0_g1~~TRINITY_DN17150_c0_g1_i1.p1  ORF type:complete len:133 (+),score=14.86 TRINITY_DN17150_c0_g1_i1:60-458(+)